MQLKLIVLNGPGQGRIFHLDGEKPEVVGRQARRLKLNDARCSRRHIEVRFENNTWIIRDLNSTNGTFVNGRRLTGLTELEEGDQIGIGQSTLVVGEMAAGETDATQFTEPTAAASPAAAAAAPPAAAASAAGDDGKAARPGLEPSWSQAPPAQSVGASQEEEQREEQPDREFDARIEESLGESESDDSDHEAAAEAAGPASPQEHEDEAAAQGEARAQPTQQASDEADLIQLEDEQASAAGAQVGQDEAGSAAERGMSERRGGEAEAGVNLADLAPAEDLEADEGDAALAEQAEQASSPAADGEAADERQRSAAEIEAEKESDLASPAAAREAEETPQEWDEEETPAEKPSDGGRPKARRGRRRAVAAVLSLIAVGVGIGGAWYAVDADYFHPPAALAQLPRQFRQVFTGGGSSASPASPPAAKRGSSMAENQRRPSAPTARRREAARGEQEDVGNGGAGRAGASLPGGAERTRQMNSSGGDGGAFVTSSPAPEHVPSDSAGQAPSTAALARAPKLLGGSVLAHRVLTPAGRGEDTRQPSTATPVSPSSTTASAASPQASASPTPPGDAAGAPGSQRSAEQHHERATGEDAAPPADQAADSDEAAATSHVTQHNRTDGSEEPSQRDAHSASASTSTPVSHVGPSVASTAQRATAGQPQHQTAAQGRSPTRQPVASADHAPADHAPARRSASSPSAAAGSPRRIAFLVDASGSVLDTLPQVIGWLDHALNQLKPTDRFTVIFFRRGKAIETPPAGLRAATAGARRRVERWMQPSQGHVFPAGRSDPVAALKKSLQYGAHQIVILSDDSISRRMTTGDVRQTFTRIDQLVGDQRVHIHTVQFFYSDPKHVLKALAHRFHGTYRFIKPAQTGGPTPSTPPVPTSSPSPPDKVHALSKGPPGGEASSP